MSQDTGIEWCHHTFNPWWGCQKISPGCLNCYADREATRHGFAGQFAAAAPHREFGDAHWKEPLKWARVAARDGIRRRAFCASMADVGEDHPIAEANRPRLWQLIEATPELDWMLLTKRADGHARRGDSFMRLVGKKAAGRRLDGVLWDEMPLTPTEPRRSA